LQRMAGYALTGSTAEHALFFGHGTGANGKSVLTNTLLAILGDYATTAPSEVFLAAKHERHPTELADLRGARLVVASEIDHGRRWNEARIKSLTGGDPVKARLMRQDFFEFRPQFKLLVVGNNRPSLRGVDEAMRRRLHLLPFTVTIPRAARDPQLPDKLRAEGPAILRWAIDGCLAWQRQGLAPPASVISATDAYLSSEDAFGLWFDECCEADAKAWASSAELFQSWKGWAERSGERAGSQKRLAQALEAHGYQPVRRREEGRGFCGLRLCA
jgi:putative DNA primase/helicase